MKTMNTKCNLIPMLAAMAPLAGYAGDTYSSKAPAPAPPAPPECLSTWFAGGGADYLVDSEEAYLNAHFGYDFGCGSSLFLEGGWVGFDEDFSTSRLVGVPGALPVPVVFAGNVDIDVIPVTLNYKYEYMFTDRFGFYIGLGAGASYIDTEASAGFVSISDSDWTFTAQAFAGLVYNVSDSFEIYGGVRYLYLDEPTIFGTEVDDLDDYGVGGGIRFNF